MTDFIMSDGELHTSLYLIYEHSGHMIEIIGAIAIPEFTAFIFPLLMAITVTAVISRKKIKAQIINTLKKNLKNQFAQ